MRIERLGRSGWTSGGVPRDTFVRHDLHHSEPASCSDAHRQGPWHVLSSGAGNPMVRYISLSTGRARSCLSWLRFGAWPSETRSPTLTDDAPVPRLLGSLITPTDRAGQPPVSPHGALDPWRSPHGRPGGAPRRDPQGRPSCRKRTRSWQPQEAAQKVRTQESPIDLDVSDKTKPNSMSSDQPMSATCR